MNGWMIYKILNQDEWQEFLRAGDFTGSSVDVADGYIHFSTASQVVQTATKHFAGKDNLVLLEIDEQNLGENLKFEPSRGGDLFPHLYGCLLYTSPSPRDQRGSRMPSSA